MIELRDVSRVFGQTRALDGISLTIPDGSFTALLGPSGCGKSTTLRLIAGLDQPSSGTILMDGVDVSGLTAAERNIAMVFQSYALYPHMTVAGNIALPLAMRTMSAWERLPVLDRLLPSARHKRARNAETVRRIAEMLEIGPLLHRKPGQLSGGQKQRAAVARALVRDPAAFLLDEPLSNLDAKLRVQMRAELVDLHRRTGTTFVHVTHDQAEAMSMADRVALIIDGRLVQAGSPQEIYRAPATREAAAFIGDHPINQVELAVDRGRLAPPFQDFALEAGRPVDRVVLGIRPGALARDPSGPLAGRLERVEYLGGATLATVAVGGECRLRVLLDEADAALIDGETLTLSPDTERLHVFDPGTGARIDARVVGARAGRRRGAGAG